MRSLKRGEKVHAPLATGCGQSSARRLEEGARHGGHRGRSPGVPVPLRAGGRLLPPKGTRPSDLGGASAAESLNCARPPSPCPPPTPCRAVTGPQSRGIQTHSPGPSPGRLLLSGCTGEGGGGVPRRLLSGAEGAVLGITSTSCPPQAERVGSGWPPWVDGLVRPSSHHPFLMHVL